MNIDKFIDALTESEKDEMLSRLLAIRSPKTASQKLSAPSQLTPTELWMSEHLTTIPMRRLYNALTHDSYGEDKDRYIDCDRFRFVELINPLELLKLRNVGKKSVDEFTKLRGY